MPTSPRVIVALFCNGKARASVLPKLPKAVLVGVGQRGAVDQIRIHNLELMAPFDISQHRWPGRCVEIRQREYRLSRQNQYW